MNYKLITQGPDEMALVKACVSKLEDLHFIPGMHMAEDNGITHLPFAQHMWAMPYSPHIRTNKNNKVNK